MKRNFIPKKRRKLTFKIFACSFQQTINVHIEEKKTWQTAPHFNGKDNLSVPPAFFVGPPKMVRHTGFLDASKVNSKILVGKLTWATMMRKRRPFVKRVKKRTVNFSPNITREKNVLLFLKDLCAHAHTSNITHTVNIYSSKLKCRQIYCFNP